MARFKVAQGNAGNALGGRRISDRGLKARLNPWIIALIAGSCRAERIPHDATMIVCPRCAHPLEARKTEHGRAWFCGGCRGNAVLLPVIRRLNQTVAEDLWRNVASAAVGKVACPFCRTSMQVIHAAGRRPEVDFCKACLAVWCDAGEREAMSQPPRASEAVPEDARADYGRMLAEQVRRRQEVASYGTGTLPPDDGWKALFGYLGLPVVESHRAVRVRPWMTWTLALVLLGVHVLVMGDLHTTLSSWGFVPAEWLRHGGLTLFTHAFLHVGWAHLLSNLYFLMLVGDVAEAELGRWRMAAILLAAILFDVVVELMLMGGSTRPRVGASGWISALIAFFVVTHPWAQICVNFRLLWWLRMPAWGALVIWGLLQVGLSIEMMSGYGRVNGVAHLAGAVMGLMAGWWWNRRTSARP